MPSRVLFLLHLQKEYQMGFYRDGGVDGPRMQPMLSSRVGYGQHQLIIERRRVLELRIGLLILFFQQVSRLYLS